MNEGDLAFVIITVVTFVGLTVIGLAEDSEGISISTIEDTVGSFPYISGLDKGTHTKDDYVVNAYRHADDELWVAYKERGGSWVNQLVDDSGSNYVTGGVICTSNGSVVILCTFITVTYNDVYMFIKYPGSGWDDWYRYTVYSGTGRYACSISINDTDHIFLLTTMTTYLYSFRYWIYDFDPLTKVLGGNPGLQTGTVTSQYYSAHVVVNVTGRFHIFYRLNTYTYHDDIDGVYGTPYIVYSSKFYLQGVACLPNDRFVGFGLHSYSGKAFVVYQDTHEDKSWTMVWAETASRTYTSMSAHLSVKQDSTTISMIAYCTLAGDEGITTWTGPWDSDETYWNNHRTETGIEDPDYLKFVGAYGELWPRHPTLDVPWTQPSAGYAFITINESGATDELQLVSNALNWSVDLTTDDPLITTESLPNGITGEDYEQSLSKSGGTAPFLWEIQTAPEWLEIDSATGVLSGTCGDTGSYTVTVKLTDASGRYDYETWTLKVTEIVSEPEILPPGRYLDFPIPSIDHITAALWWIFIVMAMMIAVLDVIMNVRKKVSDGGRL